MKKAYITNENGVLPFSHVEANQSRASQALEWFTPVVLLHARTFTLLRSLRWFEYQASCDGSFPFALLKKKSSMKIVVPMFIIYITTISSHKASL